MPQTDITDLSEDELHQLAVDCLAALVLDKRVKAVLAAFDDQDDREELIAWLEDAANA